MRTEQQALKVSLVAILVVAAMGIGFGLVSGSYAIIFDGVFSLVDAVMSLVQIVVAGLIARTTAGQLSQGMQRRFTMGFWHFEPIVLAVNALLMMSVTTYALVQAVSALLTGGRDMQFGPAIVYAAIVLAVTIVVGLLEQRANKKIGSPFVAMDVKGWLMAGGVTGALIIAFLTGLLIDGTRFAWMMPYIDPVVLVVVVVVLIPVPFPTLRKALSEIALVTPQGVREEAAGVAARTVEAEGFTTFWVYAARLGRAKQIEIVFQVPTGLPPRPLEEWDRVRADIEQRLGGGDPNHWITVSFTTRPYAVSA